ncbi:GNAT family N-acetyltransferase [Aquincola sp. MAHUQ-54]|uniref:GNAT family N-acetyltransferase n=1 Tax=Aquincola agrisoli TaxID=3119538 RepID=A0AAW9PZ31_9BURK
MGSSGVRTRRDADGIRAAVCATIASIAPECEVGRILPSAPLRDQIELDSLDWLNLISALHERLQVEIPAVDQGRVATLDAMVAYIASHRNRRAPPAPRAQAAASQPCTRRLRDGSAVTLRPMGPADAALEVEFVAHLSDESRYRRFMVALHTLPADKLRQLTQVDGVAHVALIATVLREGREVPLGVARYVVDASGTGCEFAIAVDDAWQGSGVAGLLMQALIDTARAHGLARMEGLVLASNHEMLKFARQLQFSVQQDPGDRRTMRVVRDLQGTAARGT